MAQVINTNVASLNAQRNLNSSQSALNTSLERLSSGLRINSAKDDSAGLAISERMTSQIRGLNQATRNANDGISLAQTAEGALSEIGNNLQRIRELAVQSANATNSAADRLALDREVQQRIEEVERISSQTAFNGKKVLDGTFGTANFQIGANVGETIGLTINSGTRSSQIGQIATGTSSVEVTTAALSGAGTIQVGSNSAVTLGASVAGSSVGQTAGSAYSKALAINAANVPELSATATNNNIFAVATTTGAYDLRINGVDVLAGAASGTTSQQITDAINAQAANTGVTAALSGANLLLSAADGRDIAIANTAAVGGLTAGVAATINDTAYKAGQISTTLADATANSSTAAAVNGGTITLSASENIVIAGDGAILGFANASHTIARDTKTLASADVKSVTNANQMLQRVDSALSAVNSLRGNLGAMQNRFESTIANLQTTSENLTASRSRIQDADFASETAALTRGQILQQAGVAMLAQANALPNNVLSLLR